MQISVVKSSNSELQGQATENQKGIEQLSYSGGEPGRSLCTDFLRASGRTSMIMN